jgi:hypothetical protein
VSIELLTLDNEGHIRELFSVRKFADILKQLVLTSINKLELRARISVKNVNVF